MKIIENLHGKNINFLIGSGASVGAIPTLMTKWERKPGCHSSIEDILTYEKSNPEYEKIKDLVYLYYYNNIIKKSFLENLTPDEEEVLSNYKKMLEKTLKFMVRESCQKPKRVNIFTTNYDLFFEKAADEIRENNQFFFNDGSDGNIEKKLSMKNYHKKIISTGIFDDFEREIPVINLFKMHGSVSWQEIDSSITVNYKDDSHFIKSNINFEINNEIIKNYNVELYGLREKVRNKFTLIFPEKDKFEKTVFEEYYYQNLRQMSYELEKEQTALIVFGFSFADEHITKIIERALNNPQLIVYIYCYNEKSKDLIKSNIGTSTSKNNKIKYITPEDSGTINFEMFLKKLFGSDMYDE